MPARRAFIVGACLILSSCGTSTFIGEPKSNEPRSPSDATSPARMPPPAPAPAPAPAGGVPAIEGTTPSTTAGSASGSRDNPFSPIALTFGDWRSLSILPLEVVDPTLIRSANQFNDEAAPGHTYARIFVSATYAGAERGEGDDFRSGFGLAGDNGKLYHAASVLDTRNVLSDISNSPEVPAGDELAGFIYFVVDADDTNFLVVASGPTGLQFIDVSP